MKKNLLKLSVKSFSTILLFLVAQASAQTVLVDDFTRADNNTVGNGWTEIETVAAGAKIATNRLQLGSTTAGIEFVHKDLSALSGPITTDGITNNTATMTWAFNFKQTRTDPSGFDAGNYGVGFVLCKTTTPTSTGNGYAVIIGQSGATDAIRLARFTGGTNANTDFTNIISGNDYGAVFLSVKVTYNPVNDEWALFAESNASAFPQSDPRNTATQIGSNTANTTYTATGNNLKFFGSFWNHSTGASDNAIFDDIYAPVVPTSSYSGVSTGAGTEPATLPSTTTALSGAVSPQTNAILNFDFLVSDDANISSGDDALPTLITQIVIPQGAGNDIADWTQGIQGAELSDGTNDITGTVATTSITFASIPTGSGALGNIADDDTKTYTLKIWLKTALGGTLPTTIDGLNFAFKIDRTNFTTASSATSTQFESGAGTVVESGSTNNTIAVVATKLLFVQQPTNVNQNATMSPSVTISATDPNGNRDLGYTANVLLASSGTMTGDPITIAATAGLATYSGIVHTFAGSGLTLSGTSGSLTATGNSSAFTVNALIPVINVTSQSHNSTFAFANVAWGSTLDQTFTINNTGSAVMNISSLTFGGSGFALQGVAPTTVAIGGTASFTIRFTPNAIGAFSGSVTINNNSSNQTAYVINFTGTGTPSDLSDVFDNTNYATGSPEFNSNIDYINFTDGTSSSTGKMIPMKFKIRDGGSTLTDADNLNTVLSGIKFTVKDHLGANQLVQIKTAILTNTSGLTVIATATKVGTELVFSGMSGTNVTANDNDEQIVHLRVSFDETQVIDNTKLVFAVSNVTAGAGSTFAATNGGGASSDASNANDINRIEVTATKIAFLQQPTNTVISATMSPAPTIRALDANNRLDLDYTTTVSITSSGTMTGAPLSITPVAGIATLSSVVHTVNQTGRTLTATSGSFSTINSTNFDITNLTFVAGDYRTNPSFTGIIYFNSTNPVSGFSPWQVWNSGTSNWDNVVHSSGSPNAPQNLATKPGTIFVGGGPGVTYVDAAGGANYNNIIVEFYTSAGVFGSYDNTTGIGILTGKTIEVKKGVFDLGGRFDLQGTGQLIVRDGAEMDISSGSSTFLRNASSTWEVENNALIVVYSYIPNAWTGTEIFHEDSYFDIIDWSDANPLFTGIGSSIISTTAVAGYSALFGHLYIEIPNGGLTGNWTGILPSGISVNLTHGDFQVTNADNSNNLNLYTGNTSTVRIGNDMVVGGIGKFQLQVGAGVLGFTVNGNFTKNGTGDFVIYSYTSNSDTLSIGGNMTINAGFVYMANISAGAATVIVNLKGNLKLASGAYLTNTNSAGYTNDAFNFNGSGAIQTVDVIPHASNDLMRIRFFVKPNAYVQFIIQDVPLGTNSGFTVEGDGTLDFGFNGTTALNLAIAGSNTGTFFTSLQKSTLKITNPLGITTTTGAFGNVQVVAGNRSYNQVATFWYIGKVNQVTGNGVTTAIGAKVIICELANNTLELRLSNSTSMSSTTTVDAVYGGHLYIKVGRFIESTTAYITSAGGTLRMEPGTYYYIPKGNVDLATADADPIPRLSSAIHPTTQYYLNGGTIELAGTGAGNYFQSLRGNVSPNQKLYKNITFSGANIYDIATKTATNYKNLTSTVDIDSTLLITGDAIVKSVGGASTTQSFTGAGGLVMDGTNSRIMFPKLNVAQPELTGVNVDYDLTGGFVEFYGSGATEQQKIRGTFDSPTKVVNYYNIDVNAAAGNYEPALYAGGNLDLISSFVLQGTMNVNSPAVLRMDEADFIYKHHVTATSIVNINDGAGLLYGSPFGITTVALGGTGVDPSKGSANPNAGNIRTSTRTFSSDASYGFVGNGAMPSGSGLPADVVGLYVYKNTAGDLVTLTNSVEPKSLLKFQNGIIKTNANLVYVSNSATTSIVGGALTGTDKYVQGNLQRKTDGVSSYTFPIGHAAQNAQGFTIKVTGANNSTIKGFLETNNQTLVKSVAYCDLEKHSGTSGVEHAGQGLSGYDAILDRVTFNLKSPLQWDVVSPSGGITSYDITVAANGGQDIIPVISKNGLNIRYLMKNGEPGNTGSATGAGLPSFPTVGFLTCPNGYTLNGMTSFSKFTVDGADEDNTVLPIELIYFEAECNKDGYVDIEWSTATEINNDFYTIQRSNNGSDFEDIEIVNAAGNSSEILFYNSKDENPILGTSYYRLKQTDLDGSFSYSKIARVDCTSGGDESINVFYADGEGIVSTIFLNNGERFNFKIYDDLGRIIYEEKKNISEGFSRNLLNNKDLATGIYFVTAQSEKRSVSVKLFVP